ncbi:MBL fold metallo-hydrolase [Brevundimonas naejangsanensis]|uniref:MBL fold metallo-hydrolase n=1 Tax=Brevundimonas naejangsanensis TaxID=588932 RepID=A0A494REK7_9CAUL|nr:MBL fold metallo-hydrolase [Brevundimonas naejangsanensis]AYG93829.1 MBL fold metallo-hydrolase [Brevundimonas naejangsanensis]
MERGLTYPFRAVPSVGEAVSVAPGVLWLRLPLPLALNHINVYAVEDGEGWALIDTGLSTAAAKAGWEAALAGPLGGRPVTQVICTHMHPDHVGLAGWLAERFGAPMLMSRLEFVTTRILLADEALGPPAGAEAFYRAAGWTDEQIGRWRSGYGGFGRAVEAFPREYRRLAENDVLTLGGEAWRVVVGEGHSPEHVCLWRETDGVFIAGDQILPRISSNVSIWPTEPDADPLGDWLRSLEDLKARLPGDLLVLPSHGEPFYGVTTRLEALLRGHEVALKRLEKTLRTPCRAVDVFGALFARPVGDAVLGMATGEALAHLNYLERQGRVRRARDGDGVDWWSLWETGA